MGDDWGAALLEEGDAFGVPSDEWGAALLAEDVSDGAAPLEEDVGLGGREADDEWARALRDEEDHEEELEGDVGGDVVPLLPDGELAVEVEDPPARLSVATSMCNVLAALEAAPDRQGIGRVIGDVNNVFEAMPDEDATAQRYIQSSADFDRVMLELTDPKVKAFRMKSKCDEADDSGVSRKNMANVHLRLSSALMVSQRHQANSFLGTLVDWCEAAGGVAEVLYERHRGDETPFANLKSFKSISPSSTVAAPAVEDADDAIARVDAAATDVLQPIRYGVATITKIYQQELLVAALLTFPTRGILVTFELLQPLQVVDRCTGEVYAAMFAANSRLLPVKERFKRYQRLSCTDGDKALERGERALHARAAGLDPTVSTPVSTLRTKCRVHRIAMILGKPLLLITAWCTGLIRFALSLRAPGAFELFRVTFIQILDSWLDYRFELAPTGPGLAADAHRKQVYDTFLPVSDGRRSYNRVRRHVVETLANGNLRLRRTFQHFCRPGCCRNRAHCPRKLGAQFLPAVIGMLPPILPRSRWTKLDSAIEYFGLLEGINGLGSETYREYYRHHTSKETLGMIAARTKYW